MDKVIVVERTSGNGRAGLAQVYLQGETWDWARTEPSWIPSMDAIPDEFMEFPWAEWWPELESISDLSISLLYSLVTKREKKPLVESMHISGMNFVGEYSKPEDRAYNAAHMLAALLNGTIT